MTDLDFLHSLLKKSEEDKLSLKFSNCFQYFHDLIQYGESTKELTNDISKQIKVKSESFLKNIKNIFSEIFIEFQKSHEKVSFLTNEVMKMGKN